MANDSIGKISLDLELNMDLAGQMNAVTSILKKRMQNSLKGMFNSVFKSTKSNANSTADLYEKAMDKASSNVEKNTKDAMKSAATVISQTFDNAVGASKKSLNVIGNNFRRMFRTILSMSKNMKTITPNSIDLGISAPKAAAATPTSPRAPPVGLNADILKSQMTTIEQTMDNIEAQISLHKQSLNGLRETYANTFNVSTKRGIEEKMLREEAIILRLTDKMDALNLKYGQMESELQSLSSAENKVGASSTSLSNKINILKEKVGAFFKTSNKIPNLLTRISSALKKTGNHSKSASVNVNSFGRGIKGTLGQMFKWMIILPAIASAIKAFGKSLWDSLKTNDQFSASLNQIRSNLLVAFTPIYQAILPAINSLMNMLRQATAYMASFISQLFGKTYAASFQATQGLVAAKDAMGAYGTSASQAAKAAKDAQRQLMGFDQINKLQSNTSGESSAPTLVQPDNMASLDESTLPWVQKFKDVMSKIFHPFKEAWNAEGVNTVTSMKNAFYSVWGLIKSIGKSFADVWTNGTGTQTLALSLQILQGILNAIGNIASGLEDAWNKNGTGISIAQSLFNILNSILSTVRNIVDATVDWAKTIDFSPLLTGLSNLLVSLEPVISVIGEALTNIWETYALPFFSWLIEDAIPQVIGWLTSLFDFLGENKGIVENVTVAVVAFFVAFKAVSIITTVITAIGSLISALNPVTLVIAAVIAVGVLLYKNWDTIKEKALEVWDFVKGKFQEFGQFLTDIFTKDWSNSFGIFGNVLNHFLSGVNDIWEGIKQIFSGIITFIKGVFTGNWKKAWEGVKDIFSGIVNTLGGIIKAPLNAVISLINAAIDGLNKISIDVPDWIPGIGGKKFGVDIPKIPYLAQGGIIDSPTLAMMGEQGKKEAVVPLERNLGWRDAIADKVVQKLGGIRNSGITADELRSIINSAVERIVSALEALAFYVDSEELATAIARGAAKHDRRFKLN